MSSTPTFDIDYSIPPSPTIPPVPRVSLASSISSLHSLYEQDGQRTPSTYQYPTSQYYMSGFYMSPNNKSSGTLFTDDDLAKAFQDRINVSPRSSPNRGTMAVHDVSDPSSPWKRSIRVKYSDVNMRDSNSMALQEASDLLARDMASYVNSEEDEKVEKGSPVGKITPAAASALLNARLQEALESMEKVTEAKNDQA